MNTSNNNIKTEIVNYIIYLSNVSRLILLVSKRSNTIFLVAVLIFSIFVTTFIFLYQIDARIVKAQQQQQQPKEKQLPQLPQPSSSEAAQNTNSDINDQSDTLLSGIYKKTIKSVVMVNAIVTSLNETSFRSQGSGFIYDNDGHILTNNHVVQGANNTAVSIKFINGNSYPVTVVGRDKFADLAVLKIDDLSVLSKEHSSPLPVANSSSLNIGQHVVAIGNPLGLSGTMTEGIISQLNRTIPLAEFFQTGMIQFDAPITHGNSGGPLLDLKNQVVGITSAGLGNLGFISFGIPSDTIKRIVPSLITNGRYAHPWLGISGIDVSPSIAKALGLSAAKGIIVTDVTPDSPAAVAGISAGTNTIGKLGDEVIHSDADILLGLDNKDIRGIDDILNYIDTKAVGDRVVITGERNGHIGSVVAILTERPQ